MKANHH